VPRTTDFGPASNEYDFPWLKPAQQSGSGAPPQITPTVRVAASKVNGDFYTVFKEVRYTDMEGVTHPGQIWAAWYRAVDDIGQRLDLWYRWSASGWVDVRKTAPGTAPVNIAEDDPGELGGLLATGEGPSGHIYAFYSQRPGEVPRLKMVPYDAEARAWGAPEEILEADRPTKYAVAADSVDVGTETREYITVAYVRGVQAGCDFRDQLCLAAYDAEAEQWGAWIRQGGQWAFAQAAPQVLCEAESGTLNPYLVHVYENVAGGVAPVVVLQARADADTEHVALGMRLFAVTTVDYAPGPELAVPRHEMVPLVAPHAKDAPIRFVNRLWPGAKYCTAANVPMAHVDVSADGWLIRPNLYEWNTGEFYLPTDWAHLPSCPDLADPNAACATGTGLEYRDPLGSAAVYDPPEPSGQKHVYAASGLFDRVFHWALDSWQNDPAPIADRWYSGNGLPLPVSRPTDLAVDDERGRLYIADAANRKVWVCQIDASGQLTAASPSEITGAGTPEGQFLWPEALAVASRATSTLWIRGHTASASSIRRERSC
jgi:hypothetical protein